ncbi:MAG: hypothetical protein WCC86_07310 [Methanoregula sp.]|uniref:hypothetical protein n=1 Tax=Methanoregula sp. TaxID=2052170 RepID=UPI003BB0446B
MRCWFHPVSSGIIPDIWKLPTASGFVQNSTCTYTTPGNYNVVLSFTKGVATSTPAPQMVAALS